MIIEKILPLILALVLSITYYLSNRYRIKSKKFGKKIISFSAGVSITYVLLELFPTFTEGALQIDKVLFISIPLGFIAHHIIEKEIYKHTDQHDLVRLLSVEDQVFSFVYHFIIGMILFTFVRLSIVEGVLFFIPILSYTFVSTLSGKPHSSKLKTVLISSATVLGALVALIWANIPLHLEYFLMGLALGVLLFTVIRHHVPFGKEGQVGYFSIGFLIYSVLIIISWYV